MDSLSAESYSKQGLAALRGEDFKTAAEMFRHALELDKERNRRRPEMRYLSYYGLSLAKAGLSSQFALQACRQAVRQQKNDALLYLNLGRVYNMTGRSVLAMQAFQRGLQLAPTNRILEQELARLDRRARPVIPGLSRDNPLNRILGKMRRNLRGGVGARQVST